MKTAPGKVVGLRISDGENDTPEAFWLEKKSTWPEQCLSVEDEISKIDEKSAQEGPWHVLVMSLDFIINNGELWAYCRQEINMVMLVFDKHSCRAQSQTQSWWGGWSTVKEMWTGKHPHPDKAVAEREQETGTGEKYPRNGTYQSICAVKEGRVDVQVPCLRNWKDRGVDNWINEKNQGNEVWGRRPWV